jgi:methionyl-tRNA synthetase
LFWILSSYLAPILPLMTQKVEHFLSASITWSPPPLLAHTIRPFEPLMQRVEKSQIEAMINASKDSLAPSSVKSSALIDPIASMIGYDDFAKVDLRIARIVKAETVTGATKLLRLTLEIGEDKPRIVFAGIKDAYPQPQLLEGRLTVMVANLEPRKMRFGISEGMVLAAGPGKKDIWLLSPDAGAQPGMRVR